MRDDDDRTARGCPRHSYHEAFDAAHGNSGSAGLLGLNDSVPAGYEQIRIKMDIEADCSDEELTALLSFAQRHSPVCNTICRPVPVIVERVS